jgi:hypothetical protein
LDSNNWSKRASSTGLGSRWPFRVCDSPKNLGHTYGHTANSGRWTGSFATRTIYTPFWVGLARALSTHTLVSVWSQKYGGSWHHRTDLAPGRYWVESALATSNTDDGTDAAETLIGAGVLAFNQGDNAAARLQYDRALQLGLRLGDQRVIAYAHLFESILTTIMDGELERASALMNVAEELFGGVGESWGIAMVRCRQSVMARIRGDYTGARALGQQGLELFENLGDRFGIGHALLTLGQAELADCEPRRAMAQFLAMITAMQEIGNSWFVARGLFCLATAACMCAESDLSATLLGCADSLRDSVGAPVYLQDVDDYARVHTELVTKLGEAQFQRAYAEGRFTRHMEMTRRLIGRGVIGDVHEVPRPG